MPIATTRHRRTNACHRLRASIHHLAILTCKCQIASKLDSPYTRRCIQRRAPTRVPAEDVPGRDNLVHVPFETPYARLPHASLLPNLAGLAKRRESSARRPSNPPVGRHVGRAGCASSRQQETTNKSLLPSIQYPSDDIAKPLLRVVVTTSPWTHYLTSTGAVQFVYINSHWRPPFCAAH